MVRIIAGVLQKKDYDEEDKENWPWNTENQLFEGKNINNQLEIDVV